MGGGGVKGGSGRVGGGRARWGRGGAGVSWAVWRGENVNPQSRPHPSRCGEHRLQVANNGGAVLWKGERTRHADDIVEQRDTEGGGAVVSHHEGAGSGDWYITQLVWLESRGVAGAPCIAGAERADGGK